MTQRRAHLPFAILLCIQLLVGLFTFRDYGLSWDEPLFYGYGDALGYAYTPSNWFDPNFDLNKSYGPSGDDHKNRGPAYLLLAREPVYALIALGVDEPSAWHLVNFLTFLLGTYFVYRLCLRWMSPCAAFGAVALFSTQPLLWGHAFINPKDIPFLVFFSGAILFGFEMVDKLILENAKSNTKFFTPSLFLLSSFFLGIATSIRILAPLAGVLVILYAASQYKKLPTPYSLLSALSFYTLLTILISLATWPYLWEAPLRNFFEVFRFMSDNPTGLTVLFNGDLYHTHELPLRYLPTFLIITLSEPVWPLFVIGGMVAVTRTVKTFQARNQLPLTNYQTDLWLTLLWFLTPLAYVLLRRPAMYDGFRHFLFMLPPVFIFAGIALDWIISKIAPFNWLRAGLILALIAPSIFALVQLHPYQYTYYNSLVGGTGGAFRRFETDYWLTCYKEAVERIPASSGRLNLFVRREPYIAQAYAPAFITIRDWRTEQNQIQSGDLVLVNTRSNEDRKTFKDAPVLVEVARVGATFCYVRQIP